MVQKKHQCSDCKKFRRIKFMYKVEGELVCTTCYRRLDSVREMSSASQIGKGLITLKQALEKVYLIKKYSVKSSVNGRYYNSCHLSIPICLAEKKVKLVLVEDEK